MAGKSWAGMVKMTIPSGGGPQEMTAISLKTLMMWLTTIDEDRVNEASRSRWPPSPSTAPMSSPWRSTANPTSSSAPWSRHSGWVTVRRLRS
ncbi:phage antirepressor N-terminal domain-containing protein [Corynebacterium sanguinis]|uniref:phage antirepressor N-terminal domain-containing protein n=1 Tax=Corynebacterium sanguinis TaxID=2594913 RepID=UPI00223BCAC3|nr:phage antirepressor N-terminal domain-containing protein [Corynebacterium sanguinis]MCT1613694.1 phage antirepressor N-terminal domain-containing protein [Corynebacterium sanguinis]MCT1806258.1 phage antirepressor N-terminal domain-containing protein [Corynebacterium sanguinis]MCT1882583.1 phage antirepressor N-terminal domain-containing protein [Corynebacterium sanguinis]MCT2155247.1 phage antirepressor N-terminal domain-containing protein [Corynebacterium sanguinis]MCT2159631.1 phage anti